MSEKNREKITISFKTEKLERLNNAKRIYEGDLNKSVEMDEFLDVLVKAYLSYRDARGASESSLLQKMSEK